jgi:hypothetical protein
MANYHFTERTLYCDQTFNLFKKWRKGGGYTEHEQKY